MEARSPISQRRPTGPDRTGLHAPEKGTYLGDHALGATNHNIVIIGSGDGKVKYVNPWWDVVML
jgi:hypothetical protein